MKERRSNEDKKNVNYQIAFSQCPSQYIGQTGRTTKICLQEHVRNVTNQNQNSEIYKNRRDTGHLFDFENIKIITEKQKIPREFV